MMWLLVINLNAWSPAVIVPGIASENACWNLGAVLVSAAKDAAHFANARCIAYEGIK